MVRTSLLVATTLVLGACASGPSAAPASSPRPAAGADARSPSDSAGRTGPAPAQGTAPTGDPTGAPGIRVAPPRWWYETNPSPGVPGANVDSAYALLRDRPAAAPVIVAVVDGGVDVDHEDLDDVLWVNDDEVPANGVDDDGNGYVDDVHGWNFIGGPEGRNVDFDTFEVTRVHAACTGQPAGREMEVPDSATCVRAAAEFDREREKTEDMAAQMDRIEQVYGMVMVLMTRALGGEPTPEKVAALEADDPRLAQARDIYLQLSASGVDSAAIAHETEAVRGRLRHGLDATFDPRPLVGDDYTDATERTYGNADVEGPDPSHGTAVASVIAAERDNGTGIDGVADAVRIMVVRAVPNGDERDKDVANAIRYAVDNGARVVNMSFGKGFSPRKPVVDAAVRYADEHGVLMVHAAGNDGEDLASKANFPNDDYLGGGQPSLWLEVGASSWQGPDTLAAGFSNYGRTRVDLFAPGVAVRAAEPGDDYGPVDGTSIAAPVVSGVAALLLAHFPSLTTADVREILLATATDVGDRTVVRPGGAGGTATFGDLSVTGGIVNAAAAVRRAQQVAGGEAPGG